MLGGTQSQEVTMMDFFLKAIDISAFYSYGGLCSMDAVTSLSYFTCSLTKLSPSTSTARPRERGLTPY